MDWDGENKIQGLYGYFSNYVLSNSSSITGVRIYRECRSQIPVSSPAMIGPLARVQDSHGLNGYKTHSQDQY